MKRTRPLTVPTIPPGGLPQRAPADGRVSVAEGQLCAWGLFIFGLYGLYFISPTSIQGVFRILTLSFSGVFFLVAFRRFPITLRVAPPVVGALLLQLWSVYTQLYASQHLGRPTELGKAESFIVEAMVPYFVAYIIAVIDPRSITKATGIFLASFAASCAVAWLQFLRFRPAIALAGQYTYKAIDNWDGTSGLRAVGLTFHPNSLAFQAVIGAGVMMGRILEGQKGRWDVAGLLFFSGAVVTSQARLGYIVIAAMWVGFLVALLRTDPKLARRLIGLVSAALGLALVVASKRLGYALQSTSLANDTSYNYRQDTIWKQLDYIYPQLAMTGIGPDKGLLLGTGPEDKWVPMGNVMESGYRVVLAMYGLPGLAIFCLSLLVSLIASLRVLLDRRLGNLHRQTAMVAFACWLFIVINCFTANTIDGPMQYPFAFLVSGLMYSAYGHRRPS